MRKSCVPAAQRSASSRPRLSLLDGFELLFNGLRISLPLSVQRVVVFVALHPHGVRRVYVAGSLWLDSPEQRACASLRSALWRIHEHGLPLIEVSGAQLALKREVIVDLREAETLAKRVLHSGPCSDIDLSIFSRDVLPDWYDDWLVFERERYRQLRLHALEMVCEHLTHVGEPEKALEAGLAAVASEPLRESAHCAVIRAHISEGNKSEAVRQFRLYSKLLREHLGLDPSARLRGLLDDLEISS
jgi:DNA-binding SARP family transcriptional activator